MGKIQTFKNYKEVREYYNGKLPVLSNDFMLFIEAEGFDDCLIPITGYQIGRYGVTANINESFIFDIKTDYAPLQLSFNILRSEKINDNPIYKLWKEQYYNDGLLRLRKESELPNITIQKKTGEVVIKFLGCMFSQPVPSINIKAFDVCNFTCEVAYRDVEIIK